MGSGDVGWVGLAASLADEYAADGYTVLGLNVRQYLAAFTSSKTHLQPSDVPGDYRAILAFLKAKKEVGGLKHYGGGAFHIDTGPRRTW